MNLILGSGLIGYIAKRIFPNYNWIPFKKSRYYSFEVPLADNFIVYNSNIDKFMNGLSNTQLMYRRPFSYKGALLYDNSVSVEYLNKIYKSDIPNHAAQLLKTTFMVYDISAKELNDKLQAGFSTEINNNIEKYGKDIKIDINNHQVITETGERLTYDKLISTIPLDALLSRASINLQLKAHDICCYYIATNKIDLEGAQQALVSDLDIIFYKVHQIDKDKYMIYTLEPVENPYQYFGLFFGYNMDIIEVFRIDQSLPIGQPDLGFLEEKGIYCVGSNAQWDDLMDVSSCINRLLKFS